MHLKLISNNQIQHKIKYKLSSRNKYDGINSKPKIELINQVVNRKMNKLFLYQLSTIIFLYLGYGFYSFTRKSISYMMPHFMNGSSNLQNLTKNDIGQSIFFSMILFFFKSQTELKTLFFKGIIISAQSIAYTLSKLLGGFLSDFLSCRIMFGCGLFLSGLLNISFKKDSNVKAFYH